MSDDDDDLDFEWEETREHEIAEAPPADPQAEPVVVARPFAPQSPPQRHPARRRSRRIYVRRAVALLVVAVVAVVAWFLISLFQPFGGAGHGPAFNVEIARGSSTDQIGSELARQGVISSSFFFDLRARLDGARFDSGVYQMRAGMSYATAISILTKPAPEVRVTIPEGYTRVQIAALAKADGLSGSYLDATRAGSVSGFHPRAYGAPSGTVSLEGFLYPATYFDAVHGSASALVAQQIAAFQQNFDQLNFSHAAAAGLSKYDVLIIASMIEREAQLASDRPLVAAVIYNRLKAHIPLGIDATLRYYLGDFTKPLTESELSLDTPYNTRIHTGLTPTPISNPGLASLNAAADPAHVSYMYYVDKPYTCGKLAFATTYSQFQADVAAYDNARNANHGNAPTRCP